jgi:dTDP-glucose 4,6-dehydratase
MPNNPKRLFVTGGAGFIGSAFVRLALTADPTCEIVNFDALTYAGNMDNLAEVDAVDQARHRFVRGDVADPAAVLGALPESVDAIVNFAAESHVDRSISSAAEFVRTNVMGTQVLLDAARARSARRFVQISTDEVMGSLPEDPAAFFTESSPLEPNSPYAASKAAAEHLVRAAAQTHGLDTVITRCGNNYGPRQFPEKLIPLCLANALEDKELPVYGDGLNVRDWIYVDDHCRAILAVMERGRAGGVYNIGARNVLTNLEVVTDLLIAVDRPTSLIRMVPDRPGHDRRYAIDPALIETELGWRPVETWTSGLAKTVAWYTDNPEWVRRARSGEYREYYRQQYGAFDDDLNRGAGVT